MDDRPPFDPQKAGFLLVAIVIGVHCLVVLMGTVACVGFAGTILANAELKCDPDGRLMQLLTAALAAALAFAGVGRK
jgi:hypothetical protein